MSSALIRRAALFLLLTFLVGGVISPVMAHAFHPHAVETVGENQVGALVETMAPDSCVLCDAAMPAEVIRPSFPVTHFPPSLFIAAAAPAQSHEACPELSARGPPAGIA